MPSPYASGSKVTDYSALRVCGVYMITDLVSGKTYIGSSKNVRARVAQHLYIMRNRKVLNGPYRNFNMTYYTHEAAGFYISILEECEPDKLYEQELRWIKELLPTENTQHSPHEGTAYSVEERELRSERARNLWDNPIYRAKAVAARLGNSYCKGYKCTPEQIENRKRAARISNMKRNYGVCWREEYAKRYPNNVGDLNA